MAALGFTSVHFEPANLARKIDFRIFSRPVRDTIKAGRRS